MNGNQFYFILSAILCTFVVKTQAVNRPHVIFILMDDWGFYDVPWRNPELIAPNIQSLGKDRYGVILDQYYTQQICTPSRFAFMVGCYPFRKGMQAGVIEHMQPLGLPLDCEILPEKLKDEGYSAHAIGKWHLGYCKEDYLPQSRGFKSFFGFYGGGQDYFTHEGKVVDESTTRYAYDFRKNKDIYFEANGTYSTDLYASYIEDLLEKESASNDTSPLFLYVSLQSVHSPSQVPVEYSDMYSHLTHIPSRRTFLGMITAADVAIGRIVTSLKNNGYYDNSVIIVSSDNGGAVSRGQSQNYPLFGKKNQMFEGGARVPGLIHSKLLSRKRTPMVYKHPFHITDWFATIMSIVGGKLPNSAKDSINHWKTIKRNKRKGPRKHLIYDFISSNAKGMQVAIRDKTYKVILGVSADSGEHFLPPELDTNITASNEAEEIEPTNDKSTAQSNGDTFTINDFNSVNDLLTDDRITKLVYNLKKDPEETKDLSGTKNGKKQLKKLAKIILKKYKNHYHERINNVPFDDAGLPVKIGNVNVWTHTPAWC